MEVICMPLVAAAKNLHIGNLYGWVLIDSYVRASRFLGKEVLARESWNCYSQRLEDQVTQELNVPCPGDVENRCREIVNENIARGRKVFAHYLLDFSSPPIRDDSEEYQEFVGKTFEEHCASGRIQEGILRFPKMGEVMQISESINWTPHGIWRRMRGSSTLEDVEEIPLFRKGNYGIKMRDHEELVFGQRFVQSLLPEFYRHSGQKANLGIFGNDVLTKWIYFMIGVSGSAPFDQIGLSGMVLDKKGRKVSKYAKNPVLINQIVDHPDAVRLSLLRQPFGRDFRIPEFAQQEPLRKKVENCYLFLTEHAPINDSAKNAELLARTKEESSKIAKKLQNLEFSQAYQNFYNFVYQVISKRAIEQIRESGISSQDLALLTSQFKRICQVFVPKTLSEITSRK